MAQQIPAAHEPTAEQIAEQKIYRQFGVSDEEYGLICQFLGRKPNYTETGVFSVMWSEHCSYKHSKPVLKKFPTSGPRVLLGPGEGAGIVDIGDNQAVCFKIESHNHPSAVEPYDGAATGVGGIIRDIFSMGARPVALLNSLRFGPPDSDRARRLFERVVAGIAGYGNGIGIPTVGGEVMFDESYEGNPLVNAMCVGLLEHGQIQRGVAAGVGNPVFYVGPPTGRDGIHGATFASGELSEEVEAKPPTVPKGDPAMEKRVMEACLELIGAGIVVGIQDMGAAGLTSSGAEMASKAGNGMELDLDLVPQREPDMTPYEMMLSETQERMLFVVRPEHEEQAKAIFAKWDVPCVKVGKVTDDGRLRLLHRGEVVADLPVGALVDECPVYNKPSRVPAEYERNRAIDAADCPEVTDLAAALEQVLASPNVASKEWVYRQFNAAAGGATAVGPGSDAAVVAVPGTRKALAMATDGNGRYCWLDPEIGGKIAVAEAARNVVCAGAEPLAVTDNLNFGNPEKPESFWQLEKAADGIADACRVLETPVISGNVSLYNESANGAIYPTPIIGVVGLIRDVDHITTQGFKQAGDAVILLGETKAELGGSEFQRVVHGVTEGRPPAIDLMREKALQAALLEAIRAGFVRSAHDVSDGGLAAALAECCITGGASGSGPDGGRPGGIGATVGLASPLRPDHLLFSESQSRVLLSVPAERADDAIAHFRGKGVPAERIGEVGGDRLVIRVNGRQAVDADVRRLGGIWRDAVPCRMEG